MPSDKDLCFNFSKKNVLSFLVLISTYFLQSVCHAVAIIKVFLRKLCKIRSESSFLIFSSKSTLNTKLS